MLFDCMISRNLKTLIAAAVFAGIAIGCSSPGNKAQNFAFEIAKKFESKSAAKIPAGSRIVCAEQKGSRVLICDASISDWNKEGAILWEWSPSSDTAIAPEHRKWFNCLSEVKPVKNATAILVTASGGGVALVDIKKNKASFYAFDSGNMHSACLLPDGNIVTASSDGDHICLFDIKNGCLSPESAKKKIYYLKFAHAVVWDKKRELLWAMGLDEIAAFKYAQEPEPILEKVDSIPLSGAAYDGHDLCAVQGLDLLFMTGKGLSIFDPDERKIYFSADIEKLKSISMNNGAVIVMRADESWWSQSIRLAGAGMLPAGTLKGARFYKARWLVPDHFSGN